MLDFNNDCAISLSLDFSFLDQMNPEVAQNGQNCKLEDFAENGMFYSLAMKIGGRRQMQDRAFIHSLPDSHLHFFSIFDGHGTSKISEFLSDRLFSAFIAVPDHASDPISALRSTISAISQEISGAFSAEDGGSVAVICVIVGKRLIVANLGDSRAVLVRKDSRVEQLNIEHTPTTPEECERIERMGGYVITVNDQPRVQGSLAVTRSFGDLAYKPYVISDPDFYEYYLNESSRFLLLASDGLWNEARNEEVAEFLRGRSIQDCAKSLVEKVTQEKGFLEDNTTVICVDLEEIRRRTRA